jgi:predicted component of type VI protein secretion system
VRREIGTSKEPVPPDGSPVKPYYIDSTVQGPLAPPWKLRVTAGPEAGHFYSLKLQTTLGRGNDNDIQILDPEISRNHLRFDIRDDALLLTDLGSSRGTAVDGKRIDRPMPLRNGQVIEVGRSRFVVEETRTSQPAAQAPAAAQAQVAATAKPPAAEPASWYYAEKGAQKGPVTESELRKRLATGLPRETLVWINQLDNWEPAHELGLCPAPAPDPRPSPEATPVAPPAAPAPAAEAAVWFFMDHGVRQGPVAESLLRHQLAHGLSPDTQVWNPKLDNWKPAHSVGLCPGTKPAAPPVAQPAHPPPAREKTCKKCGRVLAPQHRFCAGCGTPV